MARAPAAEVGRVVAVLSFVLVFSAAELSHADSGSLLGSPRASSRRRVAQPAALTGLSSAHTACPEFSSPVALPGQSLPSVCVDQYELAVVLTANGSAWPFNVPVDSLSASEYRAVPAADGRHPQAYLSAVHAATACENSGKRLCTATEWLAACQGPHNFTYPYGNTYHSGWCNEGRPTNPVNDLFGPHASFNETEMNDPRLDTLPHTLATGGAFPRCVSDYGCYDMHGNAHEWVSTPAPGSGGLRGEFRGGFFVDAKINGPGCHYVTVAHAPRYHDYSIGSRCCAGLQASQ